MNNCNFCLENKSLKGNVLLKNDVHYFVESIDPVLPCSGMIIPYRHVSTPFELTTTEWEDLQVFLKEVIELLRKKNPDGYNLGWNVGSTAGQHVDHVHFHVIGRYNDEPLAGQGIRSHLKSEKNRR